MTPVRERDLGNLRELSFLPASLLTDEAFHASPYVGRGIFKESLLREEKSLEERLRQSGFDPDYLFGEGMGFRNLRGQQRVSRQERIGIPSAKDGTNWFDALSAAIKSRGENDHSLGAVLAAFGIQDIKYFSDGRSMTASLKFRRGGYERIFDLLDPPQVEISFLQMDSDATGIADLAALAFVPDRFWQGFVFRRQGFVVARPDATRPQIGVGHFVIGYDRGNATICPLETWRASSLHLKEGKPLFAVSILPPIY